MLPEDQRLVRDLGRASAAVRKALRLLPEDLAEARTNLDLAQLNIDMAYKRRKMPPRPGRR